MNQKYLKGFLEKCAEHNISPIMLFKLAGVPAAKVIEILKGNAQYPDFASKIKAIVENMREISKMHETEAHPALDIAKRIKDMQQLKQ